MSIEKLGINVWKVKARVRVGNKIVQKQKTFSNTTKEEAKQLLEEMKKALKEQKSFSGSLKKQKTSKKFADLVEEYKFYLHGKGKNSKSHFQMIDRINRELGGINISEFQYRFKEFINQLRMTPLPSGKKRKPATINRPIQIVRAIYNHAVEVELIKENPIKKSIFPLHEEIARDIILSEAQKDRLLSVIQDEAPHLYPLTQYALQVPSRKNELVHAKCSDIIWGENPGIRFKNGTMKNKKGLFKPIPKNMLNYFKHEIPKDCPYIFFRKEKGGYKPLGDFKTSWNKCREKAGLPTLRFQDTRHLSCTMLINKGVPERIVRSIAGWRTDMLNVYYNIDINVLEEHSRYMNAVKTL